MILVVTFYGSGECDCFWYDQYTLQEGIVQAIDACKVDLLGFAKLTFFTYNYAVKIHEQNSQGKNLSNVSGPIGLVR